MSEQDRYNSNQQTHSNNASILNGNDNSAPSAFWRNPAFSSSNNVPRMRPMESPPPSQTLGREDMFRRHEPPVSSSASAVNMTHRIPSYSMPMSQAHPPPPPPPTLPRPSPMAGYEQQPLPPPPPSSSPSSSSQALQHTSPPQQPIRHTSPNASSGRRTRITRACDTCRRKKIKCDVDTAFPCTTCKQYDWECTFNDTAKKRGPPKGYIESLETRLKKMEELLEQMQSGKPVKEEPSSATSMERDTTTAQHKRKRSQDESVASSRNADDKSEDLSDGGNKVVRYHGSSSGFYLMRNMLPNDVKPSDHGISMQSVGSDAFPSPSNTPAYRIRKLNGFDDDLMLVRDAMDSESKVKDTDHIDNLVPRKIMDTLIYVYFDMVNATLPIVNKQEYLDAYHGRTQSPPSSLLTYAICTYACFMISSEHPVFQECGMTCDQVFHALIDRASQLIRRDYLTSGISTIKALVILCSQPTYSTSSYRNWILAGMAVRMAQDLGLHRTLRNEEASKDHIEARKRLWYSVYVTDRWCCAAMGRPLAIADSDCDVDLPDPKGTGHEDYNIFVNFIKLSGILGELLRRIYSPKAKAAGYKGVLVEQTVASLQKMLDDWLEQLPDDCKISADDLTEIHRDPGRYARSKKLEQGGPLTVCYHSITLLLHRPFIVLDEQNDDGSQQENSLFKQASRRCLDAAKLTIEIARVVPAPSIARFGWNFSVYAVFQATLIHVYNCTSTDASVSKEAHDYVHVGKECLTALTRDIPYGPPIIPFLEKLIALLGADPSKRKKEDEADQQQQQQQSNLPSGNGNTNTSFNTATTTGAATATATAMASSSAAPVQPSSNGSPMSVQQIVAESTEPPAQATWQQLFSSAGTPFTNDSTGFDLQAWTNFLSGSQSTDPLFFIP
ncbi:hypothetical protein K492DRAFT_168263 [Lichtheimia hyalospora FSU 10163]|nr:hypothetical protein K492DRAFT_168263 [Lichtheimia hyalospora FSU 10163]